MSGGILTPSLSHSSNAILRRIRELPLPGKTLVSVGDLVTSDSTVAEAFLPGDLYILRLSDQMGLEPSEIIEALTVKEGELVQSKQTLVSHRGLFGLFRSTFQSPVSGLVEFINKKTGHIGVRTASTPFALKSYISGRVVEVVPTKSVVVETSGVFVQGIFGVGGERAGKLVILDLPNGESLRPEHLPADCSGQILVGGTSPSLETLKAAAARGVLGLVVGAVDDRALAGYLGFDLGIALTGDEDISMTLIVTEGFGRIPISQRILTLLSTAAGREASINGATQVRAGALRPEIIVPTTLDSKSINKPEGQHGLALGGEVRVIRVPFFGEVGTILELPHDPQKIETGTFTRVLKIKLNNGQAVTVPRANVELI